MNEFSLRRGMSMEIVTALHGHYIAVKYNDADWPHDQAKDDASKLLEQLRALVEGDLQNERRNLQLSADLAWTHRDPVNATQRKAFGLQPDRPLV